MTIMPLFRHRLKEVYFDDENDMSTAVISKIELSMDSEMSEDALPPKGEKLEREKDDVEI